MKPSSKEFVFVLLGAWIAVGFLVLPVLVTIPVSFTGKSYLSWPSLDTLSLRHYETLLEPVWLSSIWQSVVIGVGTAVVSVALGTAAAVGLWRMKPALAGYLFPLLVMPLVAPPIATALGMYGVWHRLGIFDTYAGTILAHSVWAVGFVVIAVYAALGNVEPTWDLAARNLGASPAQAAWMVIVPNVMPGIVSGAIFAFIISWDEVVLTIFVTSRSINTLPKQIFVAVRDNVDPAIASVASVLVVATVLLIFARALITPRTHGRET